MKEYRALNFEDYFTICSCNYAGIQTDLKLAKYESITYKHHNHEHVLQYQVRFDYERNCIQCIFKETACKSDWITNFEFPSKLYDKFTFDGQLIQIKVHNGWGDRWLACQDTIREKISFYRQSYPNCYIEVFGWSLGSAMAQLCAEDVYFKFGVKPYLYTYGSVKPFFGRSTYNYVKNCCEKAFNFYDHCDIVGYMVPFIGWRAIKHEKVKYDSFCIAKLFNPQFYHTHYYEAKLYDTFKK